MGLDKIEIEHYLGPDLLTYDPYDLWKTKIGQWLRKCYYQKGKIAIPFIAPIYLLDIYAPKFVRKFIEPQEYPIVNAMAILAALNLYEMTSNRKYIELAARSVSWLKGHQSPGYHGACWGLNFHWVTKGGYYSPTTPFVTHTPYCVEALLKFHDIANDKESYRIAISSLKFLELDLKILFEGADKMAMGYGPGYENRIVVNANSYSMMLYALLANRMPEEKKVLLEKAKRLFNFVKSCQDYDGKWFYYNDNEKGNFIDCFHSCFVLKNLIKYGQFTGTNVFPVVNKGLDYLLENFIDPKTNLAKKFSVAANPSIIKFDLYDQAELLNVLILAGRLSIAKKLYESIIQHFYMPDTQSFGSQIDMFGFLNKMQYLRWGVMPMVYVLSEFLKLESK